jgi:hypothetical protein
MAAKLFNSTLKEKKDLLVRLKAAPHHDEIAIAIDVVEDALLLHELHNAVSDVETKLESMAHVKGVHLCLRGIHHFYGNLSKRLSRKSSSSRR